MITKSTQHVARNVDRMGITEVRVRVHLKQHQHQHTKNLHTPANIFPSIDGYGYNV